MHSGTSAASSYKLTKEAGVHAIHALTKLQLDPFITGLIFNKHALFTATRFESLTKLTLENINKLKFVMQALTKLQLDTFITEFKRVHECSIKIA